ncbi:hypothetical protein OEG84_11380 [Hoeflea sp. G2-23]|uniref:Uncharacterized protein n=1 Tax=Hoeflea algicola TaxID=2983763 RepID=A0ABT3ZAD5_9HYPH|nr:hypothetical protein [Hoeflea algicola]MCY0148294.1 hypothetical protein [Hoeflea algicola]
MKLKDECWYWVQLTDDDPDYKQQWQVGQYYRGGFAVIGSDKAFRKSDFQAIGPLIEPPTS